MSAIVWAAATAHTAGMMRRSGGDPEDLGRAERVFATFRDFGDRLRKAGPDVVVVIATDHFLTFDYQSMPIFAIGTGDRFPGHGEFGVPQHDFRGVSGLGEAVHASLVAQGFDAVSARALALDHSFACPTQLMLDRFDLPVLPVFVNCTVMPLPTMQRCRDFGTALGIALREQTAAARVAVLGTGGLSHWVGTPQTGTINVEFDRQFLALFERADYGAITALDSDEVIRIAGNGAAEIRCWLIAAAAARATRAETVAYEPVRAWSTGIALAEIHA